MKLLSQEQSDAIIMAADDVESCLSELIDRGDTEIKSNEFGAMQICEKLQVLSEALRPLRNLSKV